jgi:hypothetical protein
MRNLFVSAEVKRVPFEGINVAAAPADRNAPTKEETMLSLFGSSRVWIAGLFIALFALASPIRAEDAATPTATPWQDVITSQIQAFRDHDASAALSYAGLGFQATFPTPEAFFITIISSGYAPIMESRSHSFGEFRMVGETSVAQQVKFVGTNQDLYEAIYMLTEEEKGWRVQGVQLIKQPGIGI